MRILTLLCVLFVFNGRSFSQAGLRIDTAYDKSGRISSLTYITYQRLTKIIWFNAAGDSVLVREYLDQKGNEVISCYKKHVLISKYFYRDNVGNIDAMGFYTSGNIKWRGSFKGKTPIGKWIYFTNTGQVRRVSYFEDRKNVADSLFFDDGQLFEIYHYEYAGESITKSFGFDSDMNLKILYSYKRNKVHGKYLGYYRNGLLQFEGYYKKGRLYGMLIFYDENGKLFDGKFASPPDHGIVNIEGFCKNGRPEGEFVFRFNNGNIYKKINFVNGKPEGIVYYFEDDGALILTELYKNGKFVKEIDEVDTQKKFRK